MTEVTVLETGCDDIAGRIASEMKAYGDGTGDVLIRSIHSLNEMQMKKTDVLVLPENAAKACSGESARLRCDILLMPGDAGACDGTACNADLFDAACIVTYGMSPKNTITLSSISEDTCVLALQRELITIRGDVLERQEIRVRGGLRPGALLAVAGALLILGQKMSDTNQ